MTPDEVLAVAEAGRRAGCKEALFSLGDQPERIFPEAKEFLRKLGFDSTLEYLAAMSELVLLKTGLLPHSNPGVMGDERPSPAAGDKRQRGNHARERESPAWASRWGALASARQSPFASSADHRRCRPIVDGLHDGHLDRYWRNSRGTRGCAAGDPRRPRKVWPRAGSDRAAISREAGYSHGSGTGAIQR